MKNITGLLHALKVPGFGSRYHLNIYIFYILILIIAVLAA